MGVMPARHAFDLRPRVNKAEEAAFMKARRAERLYAMRLRQVAKQIGVIVKAFDPMTSAGITTMIRVLEGYSRTLEPWARAVATTMLADVSHRNKRAWASATEGMSEALRNEVYNAPVGAVMLQKLEEQVHYITSIPLDAAQRVHKLSVEALFDSTRANEIAKEILRQGHVSTSKAALIARTEVGRVAGALTQARAEFIGSEGYIWRAVMDSSTRPSHRALNGKFIRWDDPPTTENLTYHAGAGPNCRCVAAPQIPDRY